MKIRPLLLLLGGWLGMHAAQAQTLLQQESFETSGEGTRYTSTTFDLRDSGFLAQYFLRENNPVQSANGNQTFGTNPTHCDPTGADGTFFWASEGARGQTVATPDRPAQTLTLNPVTVTGYTALQVKVLMANPRGPGSPLPSLQWDNSDYIRVKVRFNGSAAWTTIGQFVGDNPAAETAGNLRQDLNFNGASSDNLSAPIVGFAMQDFTFNITGSGTTLQVMVEVDQIGGTEEFAFDNIRVVGTASATAAPVLAAIEGTNLTYTEGQAATAITSALTVSDTDSPNLSGATVSISPGFVSGQDQLVFVNQNGITGSYNTGSGVLTLSGTASLAAYQAALRSVRYQNPETVNATGGTRLVTFFVTDGTNTSNTQSRSIDFIAQLNAAAALPYTEEFETNGEGTRYASNTWSLAAPCFGFLRVTTNPYACSPTTFGNVSGTGYWYSEGTSTLNNPNPVDIGTLVLAPVNATNYSNLHFNVRLGIGDGTPSGLQWEIDDYVKFFYRVNGGSWVQFGAFFGDGPANNNSGNLRRDADLNGVADAGGTILTTTLQNIDFTLPASVTGASVDFMVEVNSDGQEELAMDRIVVTGTLNNPPVIGSQTRSVAENSANGTTVGAAVTASDPDGNTLTYAITAGNTNGTFAINSATGQLTVANSGALNFEAASTYALTVQVTDNGIPAASSSATVTVNVTNVNEAPGAVTDVNPATNTVPENSANGTTVGITASATDPDAGTTLTYSLTDNAGGRFAINASTGVVTVANGALLDFETTTSHSITVQVSDGSLTNSQSFTIAVTDVDDTRPSVSITSTGNTNGGGTSTSPIPFTITFSESVTGFVQGDLTVSGGTISGFSGSGTTYTFDLTPSSNGAVTVNVPANVAQDAAGNLNTAASQFSITYTAPATTVTSVTRLTPSPTATAQVRYQVVFARSVSGITVNNFTITNTGAVSGTSVSSAVGTGTTYTVTVDTGTGDGTLRLNVANSTGITPTVSGLPYTGGEVYTITKSFAAQPQLTIVGTGGTGSDVTAFVDVVQVLSSGSAFANALQNGSFELHNPLANGNFGYSPTGASWTFNAQSGIAEQGSAFTPITPLPNGIAVAFVQSNGGSNGQLQQNLAVPTGNNYQVSFQAAQRICCTTLDQALNVFLNGVFLGNIQPNSNSYSPFTSPTFSVTAPALTATVSTTSGSPTSTAPIPFSVSFSQSTGTTFTASDVTVTGGTLTSGSFAGSSSGPYTFTVTPSGAGTVTVSLAANVANDANNTLNSASNSVSVQYAQPTTAAPVVTTPANSSTPINTTTPTYAGTAPAGSTVTVYVDGASIGTTTATGGSFALTQPTALAQGSHTVYATAQSSGSAVSANSNTNTFTVDTVRPTVAISSTVGATGSTTGTSPIPFTVTFSENVTGFVAGDITVTNGSITGGTVTGTSPGTVFTFTVTPTTAGTATTVNVPANVAQDAASNFNTAATQYSITYNQAVALTITALSPGRNALNVANASNVAVTFSQALTNNAATQGALKVFSSQRGGQLNRAGGGTATVSGSTLTLNPTTDFRPGEVVFGTITTAATAGASNLATPQVVQFTAAVGGTGRGNFQPGSDPGVGSGPASATVADVDGDGDLDLLVGNYGGGTVSIRLNDGTGTYSGTQTVAVGSTPGEVIVGDIDADGDLDLVTPNTTSGTVSVRLNNGTGTFSGSQEVGVGSSPYHAALGDVDGDGDLDLLASSYGSGTVSVRLNDGAGNFSGSQNIAAGSGAYDMALGDVDSDGDLDVVVTNYSNNTVNVLLNNGTGIFAGSQTIVVGSDPISVALGDIDGDGDLDFLTANNSSGTVSVRLNNGSGTFSGTQNLTVAANPYGVALGDVDGDGDLDFLVTGHANDNVALWLNAGTGTFTNTRTIAVGDGPYNIALGDLDGDGDLDFVTPNQNTTTASVRLNQAGPTIISFTPPNGPIGTVVTITGTLFTGTTAVAFNGVAASAFTVNSATSITATVAAGTTTGLITVTTPGGTATSATDFTVTQPVTAAPVVTTPANGSFSASTTPTYTGTAPSGSTVTVYVDGASIGTTTATGGSFALTQPTALAQGSHTVYATAQTSGSTVSANSNTNTFTVDTVRPTVAISSTTAANGGTTSTTPIAYTVTFSENVNGSFVQGDLTVTNGSISGFAGSGTTFTFNVTPTANGAVTVNVPANVAQDAAGNFNTAAPAYTITYTAVVTATNWTGAISTDWFTAGNWTAGVPTTTVDATIPTAPSGNRFPALAAGTASARNLTLNSGSSLTQTGGTLRTDGDLTNNGTFQPTGGTVTLGTTAQASVLGSSNTRFWNLTIGTNGAQSSTSAGISVQRLFTLNGSFTTNGNPLTLESNSATTAMVVNNSGTVVGTATVQRYIDPAINPGLGYRHYSSPVQSTNVADLATSTFSPVLNPAYNTLGSTVTPFPTVFGYDESRLNATSAITQSFDQGWFSPAAAADVLTPGRGYTVNLNASEKVDLLGTLNNGAVPVGALSRGPEANAGWQLLGNPYPAPLDWNVARAGLPTGVIDAVYVFKSADQYNGTYQFYQNGFGTLPGGLIGSMQGFFVRVSQNVPAFSFQNSWRSTSYQNPTFNRGTADTRPAVQLDLVNAAGTHEPTFVYFENGATVGFDAHYDADKLPNSTGLNLSSEIVGGQRLAVNGLPELGTATVTVPLTVGVPAAGSFSFSAAQLLNLSTTPVYLRDRQTGAVVDLRTQPSYGFVVSNASALITGRFELVFAPQAVLATAPAALAAQVGVYPNPATTTAFVELPAALGRVAVAAELVDALGRTVRAQSLPAQGAAAHRLDLTNVATGVYTLHLNTSAGVIVKKLVVQ